MVWNIVAIALIVLAGIVLVHPRVLGAFRRFDARTRQRIAAEREDRADALAHFRHTLRLAEEQVEEVGTVTVPDERTGMPVRPRAAAPARGRQAGFVAERSARGMLFSPKYSRVRPSAGRPARCRAVQL